MGVIMGVTITDVKLVDICSKCREEGDIIPTWKDGRLVEDKDISCISKAFGSCNADTTEDKDEM